MKRTIQIAAGIVALLILVLILLPLLVNANRCPLGDNMNMESDKTQGCNRHSRLLLPSLAEQKHTAS